ncbi:hypothetical protein WKW80_00865 [Variovorax humicola]|uniref:Uncharacterized protein n=1 Tax=Variovorax humicola TaxID=1769758 RepID=A0ABU8VS24_9BURK
MINKFIIAALIGASATTSFNASAETVNAGHCQALAEMSRDIFKAKQAGNSKAKVTTVAEGKTNNKLAVTLALSAVEVVYGMKLDSQADAYRTVRTACRAYTGTSL